MAALLNIIKVSRSSTENSRQAIGLFSKINLPKYTLGACLAKAIAESIITVFDILQPSLSSYKGRTSVYSAIGPGF